MDLKIYQFVSGNVAHCGARHGRVGSGRSIALENAAKNILVVGGHTETKNGQVGQHKTTAKVAAAGEMSTRRGAKAQLFPRA
ncbi:MAG: hypothetical protein O4859_27985 [Trichodesmium sp. St18_bin1]|nr:hypothetical protein [Trichodesmium sp. St18_bin1]MDE5119511.1 hypothetical protein [Trichodesmium sp. St19_bin1]